MNMNLGQMERTLRIIVGLALLALVFVGPKTPWGWIGLILIGTGAIRFCPIYRLLGLSTCPIAQPK